MPMLVMHLKKVKLADMNCIGRINLFVGVKSIEGNMFE